MELEAKINDLITKENLKISDLENQLLTDQQFSYLKCEFWAQAIFHFNQKMNIEYVVYMHHVLDCIKAFDEIYDTELYDQLKNFLPSRYHDYEIIETNQKRYEFSAMLLREKIQKIEFKRFVEILKNSVDEWLLK